MQEVTERGGSPSGSARGAPCDALVPRRGLLDRHPRNCLLGYPTGSAFDMSYTGSDKLSDRRGFGEVQCRSRSVRELIAEEKPKLPIAGIHSRVDERFALTARCLVLELRHFTHVANFIVKDCGIGWEDQPRVDDVVADFQPIPRHSAAAENHVGEAACTLLLNHGPAGPNPSLPLTNYSVTHFLPFSLRQRPRLCFKVQVRLAGSILSYDFVEAAVRGNFEEVSDKVGCTAKSSVPLTNPPLRAIPAGPVVCCHVECAGGKIVRYLEHCLLRLEPINPNLPEWECPLPRWGARGLSPHWEWVEAHSPRLPRSRAWHSRLEDNPSRQFRSGGL